MDKAQSERFVMRIPVVYDLSASLAATAEKEVMFFDS